MTAIRTKRRSSMLERDPEARFWMNVKSSRDGCWLFASHLSRKKHNQFYDGSRYIGVHRYSYQIHYGPILDGLFVCHRCDNPICVRPCHLFLGTAKDNIRDASNKNRLPHGVTHRMAKLSYAEVLLLREMRQEGTTISRLALAFDIDSSSVQHALVGRHYRDAGTPLTRSERRDSAILAHPRGSRHPRSKFSEEDIPRIFEMRRSGMSHSKIAAVFNVTRPAITAILARKLWSHVVINTKEQR